MHVDFPQPVGPTRKTKSPRPIRIDTRSRPTLPPSYTFVTSSNSTTGTLRPCGFCARGSGRAGTGMSVRGTEAIRAVFDSGSGRGMGCVQRFLQCRRYGTGTIRMYGRGSSHPSG
jgi:hypothetical protein